MSADEPGFEVERRSQLSKFLRNRRARLRPEDVGLPAGGSRRRTIGLRREEVAILAGISVTWYTLFESGQNESIAPATLLSVARALRLNVAERTFLAALARVPLADPSVDIQVPPTRLIAFLQELECRPAVIWNRRRDAVAWNAVSEAAFGYSMTSPIWHRNGIWRIFNHPNRHQIWGDWTSAAQRGTSALRWQFSHQPEIVFELIVELRKNTQFTEFWERESDVTDWMHDPSRDLEIRLPDQRVFRLEPITLGPPESGAYIVQIYQKIDGDVAKELHKIFAISVP